MQKKRYHVARKNKAETRALLRGLVAACLLYLAWQVAAHAGDTPSLPPAAGYGIGALFAVCALAFGFYTWKQYQAGPRGAELPPEEEQGPQ